MARRDYDDDADRGRGRDRDDDEEDRGRGKSRSRSRDDDDDEERPRGRGKGGERRSSKGEIRLENVRLSYEAIFKPKKFGGASGDGEDEPAYQGSFIFEKKDPQVDKCWEIIDGLLDEEFNGKPPKLKDDKFALRNDKDEPEYAGRWYVAARNKKRPKVIDRNKEPLYAEDGKPYSGCYVNAIVRFWVQNNKWGKRVNASLEAVQFRKDGEAFGADPVDTDEAFDEVEEDDEDRGERSRGSGRGRSREDDRDDERRGSSRGRGRGRDDNDDDDEEDRSRRARRASREDDDERGGRRAQSRSNRREDDDDDPPPRRNRGRDDDDEDDDRGRGRRRVV